MFISVHRM
ncbi:unnamed protein product, partial [Allacma fusca]